MKFREVLKQALGEVEAADIPVELKPTALEKAIEYFDRNRTSSGESLDAAEASCPSRRTNEGPVEKLANALGLEQTAISEVFHYEHDALTIVISPHKLADQNASATRELALLTVGGRQLAGLEEWTPVKIVREMAKDFGKFDSSNFAATIKDMDQEFSLKGSGQGRQLKTNRFGRKSLKHLVARMTQSGV